MSDFYDEFIGFKAPGQPEDKYTIGSTRNDRRIFKRWTWFIMCNGEPLLTGNARSDKAALKAALRVHNALEKF